MENWFVCLECGGIFTTTELTSFYEETAITVCPKCYSENVYFEIIPKNKFIEVGYYRHEKTEKENNQIRNKLITF